MLIEIDLFFIVSACLKLLSSTMILAKFGNSNYTEYLFKTKLPKKG
jgi:hypothetical protein